MPMFPLRNAILLRNMGTRSLVKNTMIKTKRLELRAEILTTIIRPKDFYLSRILVFHKILKMFKNSKQFTFLFKKEKPCERCVIINENNIEIITKQRSKKSKALYISMNNLKHWSWWNFMFAQRQSVHLYTYTKCTWGSTVINIIGSKEVIYKLNSRMKNFRTWMSKPIMLE